MKTLLLKLLLSLLSCDEVCQMIASGISKLLEHARGKNDETWEQAKNIIDKINNWTGLFIEVYNDDKMTEEEETKIADAIKNSTSAKTVSEIIGKKRHHKHRKNKFKNVNK